MSIRKEITFKPNQDSINSKTNTQNLPMPTHITFHEPQNLTMEMVRAFLERKGYNQGNITDLFKTPIFKDPNRHYYQGPDGIWVKRDHTVDHPHAMFSHVTGNGTGHSKIYGKDKDDKLVPIRRIDYHMGADGKIKTQVQHLGVSHEIQEIISSAYAPERARALHMQLQSTRQPDHRDIRYHSIELLPQNVKEQYAVRDPNRGWECVLENAHTIHIFVETARLRDVLSLNHIYRREAEAYEKTQSEASRKAGAKAIEIAYGMIGSPHVKYDGLIHEHIDRRGNITLVKNTTNGLYEQNSHGQYVHKHLVKNDPTYTHDYLDHTKSFPDANAPIFTHGGKQVLTV